VAGAAAFVAAFDLTGGFYDLVRADSLVLALEALTLWLMVRGSTWKSAAVAGLVITAAFFTKQTASIMGVGLGVGLLIVNWRRGLVYGAVAAAALAAGVGLLVKTSDGWFWTYIFKLHQSHGYRWGVIWGLVLPDTLKYLWPAVRGARHRHRDPGPDAPVASHRCSCCGWRPLPAWQQPGSATRRDGRFSTPTFRRIFFPVVAAVRVVGTAAAACA
jgi:hypothetical protein